MLIIPLLLGQLILALAVADADTVASHETTGYSRYLHRGRTDTKKTPANDVLGLPVRPMVFTAPAFPGGENARLEDDAGEVWKKLKEIKGRYHPDLLDSSRKKNNARRRTLTKPTQGPETAKRKKEFPTQDHGENQCPETATIKTALTGEGHTEHTLTRPTEGQETVKHNKKDVPYSTTTATARGDKMYDTITVTPPFPVTTSEGSVYGG
ncbi:hypothetical protein MKZ38_003323 [Zalerion maritima]|uniref:Uncharacterized protein n=1 Tax=Zalerion maritima TaxID=339359 RepID=A0AAD5RUL6_9PEZI|nr:hypothetical protein MKZ38_003323 [Zalerion maritima]